MTDLRRLFEQEQRSLAEEGADFAADFPEAARFLDPQQVDDRDPYVERLTEGFSFLTSRIRETVEAEDDGLTRHILDLLVPELQQPMPSVCVLQFLPKNHFPTPTRVDAGSEVLSPPLEQAPTGCRFTVNHEVPIHSYRISSARLHLLESGATPLELQLESGSELCRGHWPDRIPLYLLGDAAVVWAMRFALLRRIVRIETFADNSWQDTESIAFQRLDQPSYASTKSVHGPFTDARDFLCADDRFRFFEIVLGPAAKLPIDSPLRIKVHFAGPLPRGISRAVEPGMFRTHAAVAVNRFETGCQALVWDHSTSEAPLVARDGKHREILDLLSVQGLGVGSPPRRIAYQRYSSYRARTNQAHYQILHGQKRDGQRGTRISLGGFDPSETLQSQYIAVQAECSDNAVPHELVSPSQTNLPGRGIPRNLKVTGLTRPSVSFRPHQGSDPRSGLLAFAAGHFEGWMDASRLKDGLRQVLWDPAESKRNLVEAIQEVTTENDHVLDRGIGWRRLVVEIRLRDTTCTPDTWDRLGVIDAFGSVLLGIARDATPIGSKTLLRIQVEPAGTVLEWEVDA